jgi:hypothetical protein
MVFVQIRRVPVNKIKHPWINRRKAGKVNPEVFLVPIRSSIKKA